MSVAYDTHCQAVVSDSHRKEMRCNRIITAFNKATFDADGRVLTGGIPDNARGDLVLMLTDQHKGFALIGKRANLALEVSHIVQALSSDNARAYFHRCIALI